MLSSVMQRAGLFILCVGLAGSAAAQGSSTYDPYAGPRDGQWLLDLCDPPPDAREPSIRVDTCLAYTLGIHDGYYATVTALVRRDVRQTGSSRGFALLCNPRSMTLYDLRALVADYIRKQSDRSGRAHHYVLAALQEKSPCAE